MITALTVFGVGRLVAQRQDYENSIERSYQVEIGARVKLAEGVDTKAARATVEREEANRGRPPQLDLR